MSEETQMEHLALSSRAIGYLGVPLESKAICLFGGSFGRPGTKEFKRCDLEGHLKNTCSPKI